MRHVFKISFIILFVSSLAGCFLTGNYYKIKPITNNVRLVEWYDQYGDRKPKKDQYQVKVQGDWYEATLKIEHTPESEVYKQEHFELTPRSKRILEARQRDESRGDSGGDSGW